MVLPQKIYWNGQTVWNGQHFSLLLFALDFSLFYVHLRMFIIFLLLSLMKSPKFYAVVTLNMNDGGNCFKTRRRRKKKQNENHFIQHDCLGLLLFRFKRDSKSSVNRIHFNFLLRGGVPPKMWFIVCIIKSIQHIQRKNAHINI